MPEQIKQISQRIRELRIISELSPKDLSEQLNVPLETYLEYEEGSKDIPIGFLYQLAGKFNVELISILTGDDPNLRKYSLVRKEKAVDVDRSKHYEYKSLAHNFIHKRAEPFLVTVNPEDADSPVHMNTHPGQEFNYVLEGTLKIVLDEHELILSQGDSLFFDSNLKHGMKALGGRPARFLAIIV
jgi:transcriptional regulator with XRE-family HTH domain